MAKIFMLAALVLVFSLGCFSCGQFVERYKPDGTYSKEQQLRFMREGRTNYDDVCE